MAFDSEGSRGDPTGLIPLEGEDILETAAVATPARAGSALAGPDADYVELARVVRLSGLADRRASEYAARLGITVALLVGGWMAFFWVGNSWYSLAVGGALAVAFAQVGFIGHDAGHRQISVVPWVNHLVGLCAANLAIGMSYGYWVNKHNRHHAYPNQVGKDPDVAQSVIAWTEAQAWGARGPFRWFARHQGWLFFPATLFEGFNMHVFSMRAMRNPVVRYQRTETALLVAHFMGYLTVVFLVLSPLRAVVFILVQQGLFGLYLGCAFAPNHKGMPMPAEGAKSESYVRRQVLTARNVSGGRVISVIFGGLNYQIEHHLFPTLPMRSLRRIQPLVRAFCATQGLTYAETTAFASYGMVVRHLHAIGSSLRPALS
ncbi:MAG: fatty acid desaturase family protein [Acidimicrobiales bacterium]